MRDSATNLLGFGLPLVAAFFCIPQLIHGLGADRFGVLTLLWAVASYLGLLDLGLGKVVTQELSAPAPGRAALPRPVVVGNAMLLLGMLSLLIIAIAGVLLVGAGFQAQPLPWKRDALWAGAVMLLGVPALVLSNGFKGILEADGHFSMVNAVRVPIGIWTFAAPLAVCVFFGPSLVGISLVLVLGRVVNLLAYMVTSGESCSPRAWLAQRDRQVLKGLATTGGWMSLSSLLSAFMGYVDRFVLAYVATPAIVAYYAVSQEIVTKLWIFPTSVVTATFPSMVKAHAEGVAARRVLWRSAVLVLLLVVPICAVLGVWARPILALWVGDEFAAASHQVLSILCVGMVFGGAAAVPFTALHAMRRQKVAAQIHAAEFPVFLVLIVVLSSQLGAVGAAMAWALRCAIDFCLMTFWCERALMGKA
ncbi:oligosaccharide flippase family protein [Roseateles sp.]|uniref:oligosaccharide flippase family protein n=1 Tax=Roseateles sp. TaxID=1971397 RepID=UPI0025EB3ADF|nr:oligosaccharide flippase family protein [Roseateles sp.]MBV8033827.1 oligosaccharide flippase family protein [Roseateles sp.]